MKSEIIYVNNLKSSQKLVVTIKLSKEMKIRLLIAKLLVKLLGKVLGNGAELKNCDVGVGGVKSLQTDRRYTARPLIFLQKLNLRG